MLLLPHRAPRRMGWGEGFLGEREVGVKKVGELLFYLKPKRQKTIRQKTYL